MSTQSLRILISTGIFPNRVRGNRGIYNLKQGLALRQYCEVEAVAPIPYWPRWLKMGSYASFNDIPARDNIAGFDVWYPRYFVTPKVLRALHGFFLFLSIVGRYRGLLKRYRPDVILGFFAYPYGFANALIGRVYGIPVVTSCRGSDINLIAQNRVRGKLIGWALRRNARVFSVSEALKREIVALGVPAERIEVVSNGIEPDKFQVLDKTESRTRLEIPADRPVVVSVSRLSHEKGIDVLLRAAARMERTDATIALVGDGPHETELRVLAAELGISDRVVFAGDVPHADVPVWVGAADISVLPSRFEGYPNAVVESLACGRPVVACNVGGVPEIIVSEELGMVVPRENPEALAEALDAALAREWDAEHIARVGTSRTWDTVARDMLEQFQIILSETTATRAA